MELLGTKDRSAGGEGELGSANLAWVDCLHMLMMGFPGSWDMCRENLTDHEVATGKHISRCCKMHLRCFSRCGNL